MLLPQYAFYMFTFPSRYVNAELRHKKNEGEKCPWFGSEVADQDVRPHVLF